MSDVSQSRKETEREDSRYEEPDPQYFETEHRLPEELREDDEDE